MHSRFHLIYKMPLGQIIRKIKLRKGTEKIHLGLIIKSPEVTTANVAVERLQFLEDDYAPITLKQTLAVNVLML